MPEEPRNLMTNHAGNTLPDVAEIERMAKERKQLRRLQMMMNMCMQVIAQDSTLSIEEASQMISDSREAALHMFPGKEPCL